MKSNEEILENYKKLLQEYNEFICLIEKGTSTSRLQLDPMRHLDDHDYNLLLRWQAIFTAVENLLGLTKEEIEKYDKEFLIPKIILDNSK